METQTNALPCGDGDDSASMEVTVCDMGHYGFKTCSKCRVTLPDEPLDVCPGCGRKFVEIKDSGTSFGGSDF